MFLGFLRKTMLPPTQTFRGMLRGILYPPTTVAILKEPGIFWEKRLRNTMKQLDLFDDDELFFPPSDVQERIELENMKLFHSMGKCQELPGGYCRYCEWERGYQ